VATTDKVRVLVVGETTFRIHTHYKGFAAYETAYATLSLDPFIGRFAGTPIDCSLMPNHEVAQRFPSTVAGLQQYDVVVISDAPADSFLLHPQTLAGEIMPNRLKVLGDYIRAGGGFAMIGGWMSYGGFHGKAHYAYSPLADVMPVKIENADDRMETPEGVYPVSGRSHPILAGLPDKWPDFLGYNRFSALRGTTLLAFLETGDPLLVVDEVGQGRVACFASDILPHWGSPRFQAWKGYVPFWSQLFEWLSGKS
jgi:uncharacterized membrane protein